MSQTILLRSIIRHRWPLAMTSPASSSSTPSKRFNSSADAFEEDFHKNHIEINPFQRTLLSVGSAYLSLTDPYRADMICCLSETTGDSGIKFMKEKMQDSREGQEILKARPRINSKTVDLEKLKTYPEGTLGKAYSNFLIDNEVTPDSRLPVQFIDDVDDAYVLQRYRECHDFFHSVLGMPTNRLGEVTVKWVEAFQTKLPMCIGGAIFGAVLLKPKHRQLYRNKYLPWAIETGRTSGFLLNLYFEKRFEQPLSEIQAELNIKPLVLPSKK